MTVEVGDIKIFMLISGLELIGKVANIESDHYKLKEAYAIQYHPHADAEGKQGIHVGMTSVSPMAQQESPKTGAIDVNVPYSSVLFNVDPPEMLLNQYATQTGSILAPPKKHIQMPV